MSPPDVCKVDVSRAHSPVACQHGIVGTHDAVPAVGWDGKHHTRRDQAQHDQTEEHRVKVDYHYREPKVSRRFREVNVNKGSLRFGESGVAIKIKV